MPRPVKKRRILQLPKYNLFGPLDEEMKETDTVILSVDEYEVIRLIDVEKLDQADCAEYIGVARSTVQRIYETAREKISFCIVYGNTLKIEGGDFVINDCPDRENNNHCRQKRNRNRGNIV